MHLRKSILITGTASIILLSLSACVQNTSESLSTAPPNPFAYDKVSSLCQVAPVQTAADGTMNVEMAVGNGEGSCALSVNKTGGGSYASFGIDTAPEHGKAFLYNYNERTYIRYTPVAAYNGNDHFKVELISDRGQPHHLLEVKVKVGSVDATEASKKEEVKTAIAPKEDTGKKAVASSTKKTTKIKKRRSPKKHTSKKK